MEPDIAPLARRLAEENNVDWRRLQGSGNDGRIVERDVLDYLARVMAGDEAVDPTPEPLPDGMEAWPDAPDGDVGAGAAAASAATSHVGQAPGGTAEPAADAPAPPADDLGPFDDDDLLLAGDDLADAPFGSDDLVSDEPTPTVPSTRRAPASEGWLGDAAPDRPDASGSGAPDLFDEGGDLGGARSDGAAPDLFLEDDAPSAPADPPQAGAGNASTFDFGGFPGADDDAAPGDERADAGAVAFGTDAFGAAPTEPAATDDRAAEEVAAQDASAGDATTAHLGAEDLGADEPAASDATAIDLTATDAAAAAGPALGDRSDATPDAGGLPLARTRTVLRRYVDAGAALATRRSVALEAQLDDVPLAVVVHAAARRAAAESGGEERPALAVPGTDGGLAVVVPNPGGLAAVATALAAAGTRGDSHAGAGLWVVDLSGAGIDEAVLDVDAEQLVVGRLLADDESGAVRTTLSLVSDAPALRAAAFLARVADLLEDPLRLLA